MLNFNRKEEPRPRQPKLSGLLQQLQVAKNEQERDAASKQRNISPQKH